MYWKVYRKGMHNCIDTVWYPLHTTAEEVRDDLEDRFDFQILIQADSED
ncbi:hypothetical protein uav_021 [Pseudomonas phage UAVern]|uniref:Uncharacterized protein n=1 Tax=Pseudomonas phage UAVern TaxID=2856997 RepID=A0A975YYL9_9CAUD|nr:hypothetical protein uav_021 [Pseudomonas phage UAVern]